MAVINSAPPPLGDPIVALVGNLKGLITKAWTDWFSNLVSQTEKTPTRIATVALTNQSSAIAATEIPTAPLSAGLYSVKFYLRLQTVDSVSASVVLTLNFTWNGSTRTVVSGTLGANTLAQTVSASPLIRVDSNTQVTYSTAVAFGGLNGAYALDIVLYEENA